MEFPSQLTYGGQVTLEPETPLKRHKGARFSFLALHHTVVIAHKSREGGKVEWSLQLGIHLETVPGPPLYLRKLKSTQLIKVIIIQRAPTLHMTEAEKLRPLSSYGV